MNDISITYTMHGDKSGCFTFIFNCLDSYEISILTYSDGKLFSNQTDEIKEITRLVNALNVFRQWDKESYYKAEQIQAAIEFLAQANVRDNIQTKEYKFNSLLGSKPKLAELIFSEK